MNKRLVILVVFLWALAYSAFGQVSQRGPFDPGALRQDGSAIAKVLKFSLTPGTVAYEAGKLFYDINEGVLAFMPVIDGPILQIGQENWIWAYNNTGGTIANGEAVYIDSAIAGTIPEAKLARADAAATSEVIALATHAIADGTIGFFTTTGKCSAIDTTAWSAGDTLYLSATTAGDLSNTAPATGFSVIVGKVLTDAVSGAIYVNPRVNGSLVQARYPDGTAAAPSITFGSDPDTGIYRYGANSMGLSVNGSLGLAIKSNGDIGVGIDPDTRLHIAAQNGTAIKIRNYANTITGTEFTGIKFQNSSNSSAAFESAAIRVISTNGVVNESVFAIDVSEAERLRIAPTGNVLIGTTTDDGVNKLQVNGFTKLGDAATGVKMKVLTGTTGAAEGDLVNTAHGLSSPKILSVSALVYSSANDGIAPGVGAGIGAGGTALVGYEYAILTSSSNVVVVTSGTNSENILGKPFVITVWYKE